MTDLETKAYEYFNRVIGDENVRFEIEEITENSFVACVYGKCDFWIKTAADNPLTAAKRAIRAYKLLKHGEKVVDTLNNIRPSWVQPDGQGFADVINEALTPFKEADDE
jgi:hypothetical protein